MEANVGHFYRAWTLMKQPRYFLFNLVPGKDARQEILVLVWMPTKGLQSIETPAENQPFKEKHVAACHQEDSFTRKFDLDYDLTD